MTDSLATPAPATLASTQPVAQTETASSKASMADRFRKVGAWGGRQYTHLFKPEAKSLIGKIIEVAFRAIMCVSFAPLAILISLPFRARAEKTDAATTNVPNPNPPASTESVSQPAAVEEESEDSEEDNGVGGNSPREAVVESDEDEEDNVDERPLSPARERDMEDVSERRKSVEDLTAFWENGGKEPAAPAVVEEEVVVEEIAHEEDSADSASSSDEEDSDSVVVNEDALGEEVAAAREEEVNGGAAVVIEEEEEDDEVRLSPAPSAPTSGSAAPANNQQPPRISMENAEDSDEGSEDLLMGALFED